VIRGLLLFRLQISIFTGDILDAGTVLVGVQVVVTDNQGVGVALMKVFQ